MSRGTLAALRDLVPIRPLTYNEALRVAELQANRLLKLSDVVQAPVPDDVITDIPKIQVRRMSPWPVSGCTDWAMSTWVIALNGAESASRQRFTLAHEFKHILDHRFVDVLYSTTNGASRHKRIEATCDYFAGCLLVPKTLLRRAWTSGYQDPSDLAELFSVSQAAIQTRLLQTGLLESRRRGMDVARGWLYSRKGDETFNDHLLLKLSGDSATIRT